LPDEIEARTGQRITMSESTILRVTFQGKPISRLEFTKSQQSKFLVNLEISLEKASSALLVDVSTDDEWLVVSPTPLTCKEGGSVNLSVSIDSKNWEEPADYRSTIRFRGRDPADPVIFRELAVAIHHTAREEVVDKKNFMRGALTRGESVIKKVSEGEHLCSRCGAVLPDKRPLCAPCRKASVKTGDDGWLRVGEKSLAESLLYLRILMKRFPLLWAFTVLVLCFMVMAVFALSFRGVPQGQKAVGSGSLVISSEPPGAWVIFLDNEHAMAKTPLVISSIIAGSHKVHLQLENCGGGEVLHTIEIKPNQKNIFSFILEKEGTLFVRSIPAERKILLDGKDTGKETPSRLEGIACGAHKVTVQDPFEPEKALTFPVKVEWGEVTGLFAVMDSARSGLSLSCEDGARVHIDGVYAGKTPLPPRTVTPGLHTITVRLERCLPWKEKLPFSAGEVMELSVEPIKQAELALEGDEGGTLYINNEFYGQLPGRVMLPPARKLSARAVTWDGRTWRKTYTFAAGEYRREKVQFPAPPPVPPPGIMTGGGEKEALLRGRFFDFNLAEHFSPRTWKAIETLYHDADGDNEEEMLIVLENRAARSSAGYPLFLYAVKRKDGAFETISLRGPCRGAIGYGELMSLYVLRADDFGYREIQYVCGDKKGKTTSRGSFIVYKGQLGNPSWSPKAIH
jgi:hypothetical protein